MSAPPLRVLFFRPSMAEGGADRVTLTVLRLLDRRRFAPSLALLRLRGPFLADLPADVKVHHVRAPRLALAAPSLAWLLAREAPDVLFSTSSTGNIAAALAHAAARSRARLVLSERTPLLRDDGRALRQRAFAWAKRRTYDRADLVTAVAQGIAAQLVERVGLSPARVRVVSNPMLDDALPGLAREELPSARASDFFDGAAPVILACGRLVPVKDYPTLLEAFAKVHEQRAARLCVLGEGPERAQMEARVRELGLGADVWLAGFDKNPFRYMARAALLLHASRAEGMPGAQIQAMACGLPVVSTDCEFGPREVIRDGHNGYLAPVGDARALASAVERLLGDAALRAQMSEAARRSVARFAVGPAMAEYEAAISGQELRAASAHEAAQMDRRGAEDGDGDGEREAEPVKENGGKA
ncbi:MAG TPA: glycosyltransferase [Kofleriaceae bacterium]|nr:glycosyltransferase [Kofleriaceae bacterium]